MELDNCPKCNHTLLEPTAQCPRCGVIFAKAIQSEQRRQLQQTSDTGFPQNLLFHTPQGEQSIIIIARALFLALLTIYGLKLISTPILLFPDNSSQFLHGVNLVFHEAGHVLFSPFGRFLHVLGGTLGQLMVPAVLMIAFLLKRNCFGAAVGLWWLGESLLDIAPYIHDARAGQLMLLGGVTGSEVEDYHDWEVLLGKLGMLQYDHLLAKTAFGLGSILMLTAMAWGGWLVFKGWQQRNDTGFNLDKSI